MSRAEIVHEDETLRLGVCRNLLIIAWLSAPEVAQLRAITRARSALATKHKADVGTINVIVSGFLPRFTDQIREEVVAMLKEARLQGLGSAHVVIPDGLVGVTTRSFLSTAILVSRTSTPTRVFSELGPAAAWLAPLLAVGSVHWSPAEILAAQSEVSRVGAPAAAPPGRGKQA